MDEDELRLGARYLGDGVYLNKAINYGVPCWVVFTDNGLEIGNVVYFEINMIQSLFDMVKNWDKLEKNTTK